MLTGPNISVQTVKYGPVKSFRQEIVMFKHPAVYILADEKDGTLRVGMTSSLTDGLREHRDNKTEKLVWFELHECMAAAIEHERLLKESDSDSIRKLIEQTNSNWKNLYDDIT
ncbi:MAG TPA: hypothetical protein VKO67_02390 [Smithellaceae bacterium]|nr:hypothetical protein [Smithellaceae bacterium]